MLVRHGKAASSLIRTFTSQLSGRELHLAIRIELENGEILRAKSILWMDSNEKARAAFSVDTELGPHLQFFDKKGTTRLVLGVQRDVRVGIDFYDSEGASVLSIFAADDPVCGVGLRDDEGKRAIDMSVRKDGSRELNIVTDSFPVRFCVPAPKDSPKPEVKKAGRSSRKKKQG